VWIGLLIKDIYIHATVATAVLGVFVFILYLAIGIRDADYGFNFLYAWDHSYFERTFVISIYNFFFLAPALHHITKNWEGTRVIYANESHPVFFAVFFIWFISFIITYFLQSFTKEANFKRMKTYTHLPTLIYENKKISTKSLCLLQDILKRKTPELNNFTSWHINFEATPNKSTSHNMYFIKIMGICLNQSGREKITSSIQEKIPEPELEALYFTCKNYLLENKVISEFSPISEGLKSNN
jgi:hypothetical protein